MNASDAAHHAGGVVFGLVGVVCAIGFMAMVAMFYLTIISFLGKGIKMLLRPDECDDKITIYYSLPTHKEMANGRIDSKAAGRGSNFFSDVGSVDLEYRGVGASEDSRSAHGIRKAVSKGL